MKKQFWRNVFVILLCLLAVEAVLRAIGFGKIPIYYTSSQYEYAIKPNQDMTRFGNCIYINKEGMRSEELKPNSRKILKFGDSILNGGVGTDQSELTSAILQDDLNKDGKEYQVLNVSAGSWGVSNAYAWLEKHGDYEAKAIILLFSSHDWQDQMTFKNVVGKVPFYPSRNPTLAITDAITWTYSRYFDSVNWNELSYSKKNRLPLKHHDYGWNKFIAYAKEKNVPLLIYHHADKNEVLSGRWNQMGEELENFLTEYQAIHVSGLQAGLSTEDYKDDIHPKPSGLAKIEKAILPELEIILEK